MWKSFGANWQNLKNIYILYIRSLLEQSCTVWHGGLTLQNAEDLERIQKCTLKKILREDYKTNENATKLLDLQQLCERREYLCLQFAKRCIKHGNIKDSFPLKEKRHGMITRHREMFEINTTHTKRLENWPVIYMKKLLNEAYSEFLCLQPKLEPLYHCKPLSLSLSHTHTHTHMFNLT